MTTNNFEECLERVLKFEGGYCNNPADRGGPTNKGITQVTYDNFRIGKGLNRQPVSGISGDEVREIYKNAYWKPIHGDDLPEATSAVLFDAAVHSGVNRATRWLQKVVGVKQDGAFGPATFRAVNEYVARNGDKDLAREMVGQREAFLYDLIERDPNQATFAKGWNNRLVALRSTINGMA